MKFEQRSVENDLRAQIAEQQREIIRLKIIDEVKEKKFQELHEKLDIHIETVQVQLEEAKNELIEEAKKKGNEQNEDLSQTEIVTLFKNCIIVPDSNSFHTHADVQPFLKALNAGVDNLRFRVNFMSPLKKERGWNIDQHFYHGTDEDGAPCFFPKIIHVNNKKLITFGDYALRFCIIIGEKHIFPIIIFQLFSPQDGRRALTYPIGYAVPKIGYAVPKIGYAVPNWVRQRPFFLDIKSNIFQLKIAETLSTLFC